MIENPNKYGLGSEGQSLDPVANPKTPLERATRRRLEASPDGKLPALARAPINPGKIAKKAVAIAAVAAATAGGIKVMADRDSEYLRKNTPVAPVTTVAPGIPTQEQLDDKTAADAADRAAQTSTTPPADTVAVVSPSNGE